MNPNKINIHKDPQTFQKLIQIAVEIDFDENIIIAAINASLEGKPLTEYRPSLDKYSLTELLDEAIKRTDDGSKKY